MDITSLTSIGGFILAIPQGIAALIQLTNLPKRNRKKAVITLSLLIAGTFCAIGLGYWNRSHPPQPEVITKIVDRPVPCPPSKTGPATTHDSESPAISGSQNSVNYGPPNATHSTAAKKEHR